MFKNFMNDEYIAAERNLIDYAVAMNSGRAFSGELRTDITESELVLKRAGVSCEYRYENVKQVLDIDNFPRN